MTAALEGVSGQQHAPATLYPRDRPGTHFTGGWVGPQARSGRAENIVPTGFRSRTATARSSVTIQTELPGPLILYINTFVGWDPASNQTAYMDA